MVVPGKKSGKRASVDEVAEKTLWVLKHTVPAAVPGIAFLSGGQSDEDATAHLDAMNKMGPLPWRLTFSYDRALQAAPQKAWSGKAENVAAAQRAFSHRARMNGLATLGHWKADLEKKAASGGFAGPYDGTLRDLVDRLRQTYSGTFGVEMMDIPDKHQREWLISRMGHLRGQHHRTAGRGRPGAPDTPSGDQRATAGDPTAALTPSSATCHRAHSSWS